jgi:EAL domain-containing protein (putative c-di-GMP-specific phosphodiesterase class I)
MVFEKAFELVASWCEQYGESNVKPLAVNVSARQFQEKSFVDDIYALLQKQSVEPSLIQFELTESLFLENQIDALIKLNQLEPMGFSLAIDDFGTGYSSLSYISKLPIDKNKGRSDVHSLDT